MLDLGEIAVGGIFCRAGRVFIISEHNISRVPFLRRELEPFAITPKGLSSLGFRRQQNGFFVRETAKEKIQVGLMPEKLGYWSVHFNGGSKVATLSFIHQVQHMFYSLYRETLFLPGVNAPHESDRENPELAVAAGEGFQPYYVTWDLKLLVRSASPALWKIFKYVSPNFRNHGYQYGVTPLLGDLTRTGTREAYFWLCDYVDRYNLSEIEDQ